MGIEETDIKVEDIKITPEAAEQIRNIRRENQIPETHGLRIGVQSGCCCGSSYLLAFDEKADPADKVFLCEGISVFVDEDSIGSLAGTKLEYVDGPQGKGFRFDNPNKSNSCECGDGSCGDH